MRFFVGVTDYDWFRFLAGRPDLDEVNFWQPSERRLTATLQPGDLFLFKLHAPRHFIVGGGLFAHWTALPVSLAWEAFREKNGAATLQEVRTRIARYRHVGDDPRENYTIGCTLLEQPFFFEERDWIPAPADWSRNIVRGDTTRRAVRGRGCGNAWRPRWTPQIRPLVDGSKPAINGAAETG